MGYPWADDSAHGGSGSASAGANIITCNDAISASEIPDSHDTKAIRRTDADDVSACESAPDAINHNATISASENMNSSSQSAGRLIRQVLPMLLAPYPSPGSFRDAWR